MKRILFSLLTIGLCIGASAQENNSFVHEQSDGYEWPTDPAVLEKLDAWQDLKFGVLMHWGLYSVPGIVESWSICNEDWITRPEGSTYDGYKQIQIIFLVVQMQLIILISKDMNASNA